MSSNYYNLDGIQTELKKKITVAEARLAAWEAVTFPTKKDGNPFKTMSKNISGASYYMESWAMQPGEYRLRVTTWADGSGYISSEIDVYCLVKYLSDEKKRVKTQNYQPKIPYLEQVYTYDIEDIKEAVSNKIQALKKEIAHLNDALLNASTAYFTFREAYRAAVLELEKNAKKEQNSTLYYMVLDTVKERFPNC